ncbi:MAG: hypothetical protein IT336_08315 [Thermomicrobiales bacterium]|nr:hypothetical protein [Thermomicrobiales bacterium]
MSALQKLDSDSFVVVPKEVLDAAGIQESDRLRFRVLGPHHIEMFVDESDHRPIDVSSLKLPRMSLEEIRTRFPLSDEPFDDRAVREAWEAEAGQEIADRILRGLE